MKAMWRCCSGDSMDSLRLTILTPSLGKRYAFPTSPQGRGRVRGKIRRQNDRRFAGMAGVKLN